MPEVFVSVGSNVEPARHVRAGVEALRRRYDSLRTSTVYQCPAVGFRGDDFYNLVLAFDTHEGPHAVAGILHEIEAAMGRRRGGPRFASRTLDLDLILHGDTLLREPGLALPRPDILRYAFVLRPLAELAPGLRHPLDGRSYAELWAAFDDRDQPMWPARPSPLG
ncbi:MAG TPA: 2-amino-4-hydroxy-6-hydroxymethyldihydropteridine diphosphokinase [Gammaproteobacteria bacterium]|nr:2-amino-4-hydroxy-6-hydroxymethyldihydropteridine diphosphokinase [Gammaproteobacteria bacterium]